MIVETAPTGWRVWGVNRQAIVSHTSLTPPQVNWEAICIYGSLLEENHIAPVFNCTCGWYIFKNFEGSREYSQLGKQRNFSIYGRTNQVQLYFETYYWGRVIECENGFRAQFCYPKRAYIVEGIHPLHLETLRRYGVEVILDMAKYRWPTRGHHHLPARLSRSELLRQRGDMMRRLRAKIEEAGPYRTETVKKWEKELTRLVEIKSQL